MFRSRLPAVSFVMLGLLPSALLIATSSTVILHQPDGQPGCIVEIPSPATASVGVNVREPVSPGKELLNQLPPDGRDFSSLPMAVRIDDPSAGAMSKLPDTIEADVRHLAIDGVDSSLGFVRATFRRSWLIAGAVVVGERSRVSSDGRRVSTQTRCEITAADEAHWR